MATTAANASVYGGDEINAIVLDPGSFHTRIGYAGDDFPKVITPSYYAVDANDTTTTPKRIFGELINVPRANHDIRPILTDSVITDWDAAIAQYTQYFETDLKIDYSDQPLLVTEPVWTNTKYRKQLVETFYELFGFSALYLARAPTCISFQQGRPNCLVVDIGHDSVSVTPVIDGISLLKNSMRTHYAGKFLSDQFQDVLSSSRGNQLAIEPTYKIKSKIPTVYPAEAQYTVRDNLPENITTLYEEYQRQRIFQELKETLLEAPEKKMVSNNVTHNTTVKEMYKQDSHKRMFEFPTGQSVELSVERFQVADSIFEPQSYKFKDETLAAKYPPDNGVLDFKGGYEDYKPLKRARKAELAQSTPPPSEAANGGATLKHKKASGSNAPQIRGLSQLITQTLTSVDIDLRSSVAHNVIVTGSTSLIPQLTERLYGELLNMNPGLKIRLHATGNSTERFNQTWIGGSVLASLGSFHQMWVSKEEYEEAGTDRILSQRFR